MERPVCANATRAGTRDLFCSDRKRNAPAPIKTAIPRHAARGLSILKKLRWAHSMRRRDGIFQMLLSAGVRHSRGAGTAASRASARDGSEEQVPTRTQSAIRTTRQLCRGKTSLAARRLAATRMSFRGVYVLLATACQGAPLPRNLRLVRARRLYETTPRSEDFLQTIHGFAFYLLLSRHVAMAATARRYHRGRFGLGWIQKQRNDTSIARAIGLETALLALDTALRTLVAD